MAYQRRYFPALTITTTAYGDKSVTTDKLADKAVTTPKVADDAITSDQIDDETIKSEDIKAGEVKTSDLASGSVTTDKIASQAVTADKLEASIREITRPLTPALDTDEIQDAKVTLSKLAPDSVDASKIKSGAVTASELNPDAVETVKIKDAAVTTDKIAPGAVTENKIGTDAVTGPKILNRCIGNTEIAIEGCHRENVKDEAINTAKLADEAVSAAKLKPDAVTEPKLFVSALARRHINSLLVRESIFREDFGGHEISNRWVKKGLAGGLVVPDGANGIKIQTGPLLHDTQEITFGGNGIVIPNTHKPSIMFMLTGRTDPKNAFRAWMGLRKDTDNYITFTINDVGAGATKWQAECKNAAAATIVDTGVLTIDGIELFEIDISDPASVKFYINANLVATITTDIPAAQILEPWFYLDTGEAVAKHWTLKYVNIMAEKPDWV